ARRRRSAACACWVAAALLALEMQYLSLVEERNGLLHSHHFTKNTVDSSVRIYATAQRGGKLNPFSLSADDQKQSCNSSLNTARQVDVPIPFSTQHDWLVS